PSSTLVPYTTLFRSSDGGTGELVEDATVLLHVPGVGGRITERLTVKPIDPVRLAGLDTIAEPRCFLMTGDPNAQHPALKIQANQQADIPGVAVWRHGGQYHADRSAVFSGNPGPQGAFNG